MVALDIDGTLLDYNYIPGQPPRINQELFFKLAGQDIILVSNQGGLVFGVQSANRSDGRKYPTPEDFIARLGYLMAACAKFNINILGLHVCVYHPKASPHIVGFVEDELVTLLEKFYFPATVYNEAEARKPSPYMLVEAGATLYYGDSDEDEQAAQAAGIEFVRVDRFL